MAYQKTDTCKDELLRCAKHLLSDNGETKLFECFVAYYGVDGKPRRTLQEIADEAKVYGFAGTVTRERVRQIREKAEQMLHSNSRVAEFRMWADAVKAARSNLPMSLQSLALHFGYAKASDPEYVYKMLRHCADILGLCFPFEIMQLSGAGTLIIDSAATDAHINAMTSLPRVLREPYVELNQVARKIGCEETLLRATINAVPECEFLDEACQYLWKRPYLPPQDYTKTGNAILTSLCKVFSAVQRVTINDLALSIARDRVVRKYRPKSDGPIPISVLVGIARRSGLFECRGGEIVRKLRMKWCAIGERDMFLLRICSEYGRVISSRILYSRLVQYGLGFQNAAVTIAYSPFLVHTQPGRGHKRGIYKFVFRPEELDISVLDAQVAAGDDECQTSGADIEPVQSLRIPISSRVRLSGRHPYSGTAGMDGTWKVQNPTGTEIGSVTISGGVISGLVPVIDSLGLGKEDILRLQRGVGERIFVST